MDQQKFQLEMTKIERDAELCAELFRCAEDFWRNYVATGLPPPVDPRHNKVAFRELSHRRSVSELAHLGVNNG